MSLFAGISDDRNRPECKTAERESIFARIIEHANDAIVVSDEKGAIIEWNPSAERLFGIDRSDAIGQPTWELQFNALPESRRTQQNHDRIESIIKQFLQTGKLQQDLQISETEIQRPDGIRLFIQTAAFPIKSAEGFLLCSIGRDITERKQVEAQLADERQFFRLVLDHVPGFVCVKTRRGTFRFANAALARAYGTTVQDLEGKSDADFSPTPGQIEKFRHDDLEVMDSRRPKLIIEEQIQHADGTLHWLTTIKVPLVKANGACEEILAVATDITELKRAEEGRLKLEQTLGQTQKLESLGVLAGGIAHDFNNLMGGIFGYIDLAIAEPDNSSANLHLSSAMKTIERARGLTSQLLTFARGGAPVQETMSLMPFLQETAHFALSGSSVSCRFDIQKDLWPANIDKNQIGQVIDNIIINAQHAMANEGTIEVRARNIKLKEKEHESLAAGNYVKISIKDRGIGIPKEIMPRLFEPFFTTKAMGHGLGLATCYSIINKHCGAIDVESEPSKGSTFHVYLPASDKPAIAHGPIASMHKGSGTVIVMDDEEVIRDTLANMLRSFGYSVISCTEGRTAVAMFANEMKNKSAIVAMVFDITIPGGMGGKAAVKEIRKLNPGIPVFVASGYADDQVMKNPAEYGFTDSINKPFSIMELSEMLSKHLKANGQRRDA
jgi:PAS domain S-box-containing protein